MTLNALLVLFGMTCMAGRHAFPAQRRVIRTWIQIPIYMLGFCALVWALRRDPLASLTFATLYLGGLCMGVAAMRADLFSQPQSRGDSSLFDQEGEIS